MILPAEHSDIPAIVSLINLAYRGENPNAWTTEAHLIKGTRTDTDDVAEIMTVPASFFLKYVDPGDTIVGCVNLKKQGNRLYVGMLSVLPDWQDRGIGKKFLAVAEEYAKKNGCVSIFLTVVSARHELVAWYERHGYKRTGEAMPFHEAVKFGEQKIPLELIELEKPV